MIRVAIATAAICLTLSACSSSDSGAAAPTDTSSSPAAVTTTTTTTTTKPARVDFFPDVYVGMGSGDAVVLLKRAGWDVLLWDKAGSASWTEPIKVVNVTKDEVAGVARIEVTPVEAPKPAEPTEPAGISDGTYLVGTDMDPGSYKSTGSSGCYWARMKDDAGKNIIANDYAKGPTRFTAKKGEYVKISGCTFTKV